MSNIYEDPSQDWTVLDQISGVWCSETDDACEFYVRFTRDYLTGDADDDHHIMAQNPQDFSSVAYYMVSDAENVHDVQFRGQSSDFYISMGANVHTFSASILVLLVSATLSTTF